MPKSIHLIIPLFALAFLLVSCKSATVQPGTSSTSSAMSAPSTGTIPFDGALLTGKHVVILKTSMGDITVELDADAAPKTVTNFVTLAKAGYYDNLLFHRVIPDFMIQGGDPKGDGTGGESIFGPAFEDEINAESYNLSDKTLRELAEGQPLPPGLDPNITVRELYEQQGYAYNDALRSLPMKRGYLAMANGGPNTNASQFFIIVADETPWLDGRHTVFGRVTAGMEIVDAISKTDRDPSDKPTTPVTYTVEVKN